MLIRAPLHCIWQLVFCERRVSLRWDRWCTVRAVLNLSQSVLFGISVMYIYGSINSNRLFAVLAFGIDNNGRLSSSIAVPYAFPFIVGSLRWRVLWTHPPHTKHFELSILDMAGPRSHFCDGIQHPPHQGNGDMGFWRLRNLPNQEMGLCYHRGWCPIVRWMEHSNRPFPQASKDRVRGQAPQYSNRVSNWRRLRWFTRNAHSWCPR